VSQLLTYGQSYPRATRPQDGTPKVHGDLLDLQVRDLRPGDVCGGSGITILENYGRVGRKCSLRLRYANGNETRRSWGAYTRLRAIRPEVPA
jgi:hypothetical protein